MPAQGVLVADLYAVANFCTYVAWGFLGLAVLGFCGMIIRSLRPKKDVEYLISERMFSLGLATAIVAGIIGPIIRLFSG